MTLRERQDYVIFQLSQFQDWSDSFSYMIKLSDQLPAEPPAGCPRIDYCQSRTYFKAFLREGKIQIEAWSNSSIVGGMLFLIKEIFHDLPISELSTCTIDFHRKSGLIDKITPTRKQMLTDIIGKITVLSP